MRDLVRGLLSMVNIDGVLVVVFGVMGKLVMSLAHMPVKM